MAEVKLEIPDEAANSAMAKAIMVAIGKQGEEAILKKAVDYLITPVGDMYSREKKSPLMQVVEHQAVEVARVILKEKLSGDPVFKARVKELFAKAVERAMSGENEETLVNRISWAIGQAIMKE